MTIARSTTPATSYGPRLARSVAALLAFTALAACGDRAVPAQSAAPRILAAFFGLDDALPPAIEAVCPGGTGMDGMPVIVDAPIAEDRLDPARFRVLKASGADGLVRCATLLPAVGPLERRTILLVGDLGDATNDPPARVVIRGPIALRDGGTLADLDFTGVTPLEDGARIVVAERFRFADVAPRLPDNANQCPRDATVQLVNLIWQGGITAAGGGPLGERERAGLHVTVRDQAGAERTITPRALGDLNDRDNHLHLCIDTTDDVVAVTADAGLFFDPRGDANPATSAPVVPGTLPNDDDERATLR